MIVAHLRRFNQKPEWNVPQVLSIQAFFMSSPHLHHSDDKFGCGGWGAYKEIKEIKEIKDIREIREIKEIKAFH